MCIGSFPKATELADLTSKISLLEDAKKKKEEEAQEWQQKVGSDFLSYESALVEGLQESAGMKMEERIYVGISCINM